MSVGTHNIAPATNTTRSDKTRTYRERFKPIFEQLKVSEMSFYPKMLFQRNRLLCVALYKNELERTEGFYTVIVDPQFDPLDGEFKLYHLKQNPKYATEYSLLETDKWAIPYDAFEEVDMQLLMLDSLRNQPIKTDIPIQLDNTDVDSPMSDMTVRDFAAITWRVPVSNKDWLNQMIKEFSNY